VSGFWSDVGGGLKKIGVDTATGAARSAAGSAGTLLSNVGKKNTPPPAQKTGGVPTGVLIAGSVVLGIGLLALLTHRKPAPVAVATNPRRRRRRRRGSR